MTFTRLFFSSSLFSGLSSALNLITTLLVVRWFGNAAYSHYVVDLAVLALGLVILEAIPSSFSIFRIQDDPQWSETLAAQLVLNFALTQAAVIVLLAAGMFSAFSAWIAGYAAATALKRYVDTLLQSSGRVHQFMMLDAAGSAARLLTLGACHAAAVEGTTAVWSSLALGTWIAQLLWVFADPKNFHGLAGFSNPRAWQAIRKNAKHFRAYYVGIALKRVKDNIVPIAAERILPSKDLLAAFFLIQRGTNFVLGQMRILEALLNFRKVADSFYGVALGRRLLICTLAQALCLIASACIVKLTGEPVRWAPTFALSFVVWPVSGFMIERAAAYSKFRAHLVNVAVLAHLAFFACAAAIMTIKEFADLTSLACLVVAAEAIAYLTLRFADRGRT